MAGRGNPVQVEVAHGPADLADQEPSRAKGRVVSLAPEQADLALEMCEIVQQRAAAAHLTTVEARAADVVDLDVQRVLVDAGLIAEHVDEQVVATNLAEQR